MASFFITGSGTGIGKTLVMTTLCWQLRQLGKRVTALKPVISGFSPDMTASDTALILKSCGLKPTPALMKTISPWQFSADLAPSLAAAREGKILKLDEIVKFSQDHVALQSDAVLVEGAGGVMAPLNERHTVLDWMDALKWPAIVVAGSYLGSISHTLTAVEVLRSRNVPIRAVVVSESEKSTVSLQDTASSLESFMPQDTPVVKIPRAYASEETWKHMPPISWMCEP